MTIKALISMSKTCKFLVKETYIHVKKEQGLPFEVLGKLLEIIYFSSLQFGNFSSISFSSAVRLLSWFMILIKTTVGLFKFPLNLRDSFELTVQNGRISVAHSIHY